MILPGYTADDGGAEADYPDAHSAQDAAQSYTDDGDWGSAMHETQWATVYAWRKGYVLGEDGESIKLTIDRDRYTGVVCREVCAHCGVYRETDTWAQDMATGEQGLTKVSYEDADSKSIAWADGLRMTAARDAAFALLEADDRIVSYISDDDDAVAVIDAVADATDVGALERDINRALRDADCYVDADPAHMPDGAVFSIRLNEEIID